MACVCQQGECMMLGVGGGVQMIAAETEICKTFPGVTLQQRALEGFCTVCSRQSAVHDIR